MTNENRNDGDWVGLPPGEWPDLFAVGASARDTAIAAFVDDKSLPSARRAFVLAIHLQVLLTAYVHCCGLLEARTVKAPDVINEISFAIGSMIVSLAKQCVPMVDGKQVDLHTSVRLWLWHVSEAAFKGASENEAVASMEYDSNSESIVVRFAGSQ